MPQAIIRVAKIKTAGAARGKTAHNYRLTDTPNADPERTAALNKEYVNTDRADYWSLAEQRIAEVVTRKVRDDQVRAMEFVLTASPEWFKRGADGQAEDMRESKWVADNLHFLKEKFGEKNVVSFTLHQDEKTPHVHAVIVPITPDGRLSAKELFTPKTLRELHAEKTKQQNLQTGRRADLAALNAEFARMLARYRELRGAASRSASAARPSYAWKRPGRHFFGCSLSPM